MAAQRPGMPQPPCSEMGMLATCLRPFEGEILRRVVEPAQFLGNFGGR